MTVGVVGSLVHAQDDREVDVLARGGDQHLPCPALQVRGGRVAAAELARGFHDDVHAESGPVNERGVSLRQHRDLAAADGERVLRVLHLRAKPAVSGVEFQ